ncbi:arylsulfatase [Rubinisphaera sp.]|uniref:sulfatase family protein n=1 Tax=Rubinisphaera sp. TaxID=2024857 RepID=UPI002600EC7F|nr:arylsulfatase [Rubinisphaera sp.]
MIQFLAKSSTHQLETLDWRREFPRHLLHRITTLAFVACAVLIPQTLYTKPLIAESNDRPNIVLILADDLGYGSLNSYGADESHIRTPNIDRLSISGRRFTDANTPSSVCSPTRYGLLTGRYDWRTDQKHGVLSTTDPLHIDTSRSTIATLLKSAGYRTAAIGKWHLGYGTEKHDFTKPLSPGPLDLGFDYHFAVPQNHGDASGVYVRNQSVVGLRSDQKIKAGKSSYGRDFMGIDAPQRIDDNVMEELTSDAIRWLQQKDSKPFFLYFAPVAIHFPYTPSEQTKGKSGSGLYGDWIHELDLSVGRILNTLDRMKVSDNTLVIFTSDNGGVLMTSGDRPEAEAYRAGLRCNGKWRGRKHSIYEGGFRVPFIVSWPGHVDAGSSCDQSISLVDMYATLAAIVDQPVPADESVAEDSFNVLPAILGVPSPKLLRPSMILHSPNGNFAIRRGPWKYIEGKSSPTLKKVPQREELHAALYNLQDDPSEQKNVLVEHPDIAKELSDLLNKQRNSGRSR